MTFDTNTINWIMDRVENREPLFWPEFIKFMRDLGASEKDMKKYLAKRYRELVKKTYTQHKKEFDLYLRTL